LLPIYYLMNNVQSNIGVYVLLFYSLIFRPITDGLRLYQKKLIKPKDFVKLYNPYFYLKFFKDLYLK
jgi:hypothetical protein